MIEIIFIALALAMLLSFARLLVGPTVADRVVALDLIATAAVGMLTVRAVTHDEPVFLDIAVVLALITFVGTVAFASFVERRARP